MVMHFNDFQGIDLKKFFFLISFLRSTVEKNGTANERGNACVLVRLCTSDVFLGYICLYKVAYNPISAECEKIAIENG